MEKDFEEKRQLQFNEPSIKKQEEQQVIVEHSPFLEEYQKEMSAEQLLATTKLSQFRSELEQEGIAEKLDQRYFSNIHLKIVSQSINRQAIVLNATCGSFSMNINILNIKGQNAKHGAVMDNGAFGCVYKGLYRNKQLVVKCITLTTQNGRRKAIKQWFIAKLGSVLNFGPKLYSFFGFDIIMYENCAEFAMEICSRVNADNFNEKQLYQHLALMHQLRLIHIDIKPMNIMYSHYHKKIIFIDFGLSRFIQEEIGKKSLTNFRGCLDYCSNEMKMCFVEQKALPVDLYYNDLCCLKSSINEMKSYFEEQAIKEDYDYIDLKMNSFDYCALFYIKFELFNHRIQELFTYWKKQIHPEQKKCFISDILQFILELAPSQNLKKLFFSIVDESLIETEIYSRIKLIYETVQQRLSCIEFLIDDEKQRAFQTCCSQYLPENNIFPLIQLSTERQVTLAELIMSKKEIQLVPFTKYVGMYLEYISYVNNKCKITFDERQKAAKIYHQLFIHSIIPEELKGRVLVEKTIRHILQWLLNSNQFERDCNNFAIFAFRMLDFLLILCCDTSQQFLQLIGSLFHHKNFSQTFKIFFLMKVKQSKNLIAFRLLGKSEQPRVDMLTEISLWVADQRKKCQHFQQVTQNIRSQCKSKKLFFSDISKEFMDQFGIEIIEYWKVKDRIGKIKYLPQAYILYVELFNKVRASSAHLKIFNFIFTLFNYSLNQSRSFSLCQKVCQIVKNNFADPSLFSQYLLEIKLNLFFSIEYFQIESQNVEKMQSQFIKMKEKDFLLLNELLRLDVHRLSEVFQAHDEESIKRIKFLQIFYKSYLAEVQRKLSSEYSQSHFFHLSFIDLINLNLLGKQLKMKQLQDKMLSSELILKASCPICRGVADFYCQIQVLLYFFDLLVIKNKTKSPDVIEIMNNFVIKSKTIEEKLIQNETRLKTSGFILLMQIVLDLKFQLCKYNYFNEIICNGVSDYYNFSLRYDLFSNYFQNHYRFNDGIFNTMIVLLQNSYGQLIRFLIKLIEIVEKTLLYNNFYTVKLYFSCFLRQNLIAVDKLFFDLKNYQNTLSVQSGYIAILYAELFMFAQTQKLQNKIAVAILKEVLKVTFRFQREIMMNILYKKLKRIEEEKVSQKERLVLYWNNKFGKLLIVERQTKPSIVITPDPRSKTSFFKSKLSKMEKIAPKNRWKFKTKKMRK